MFGSDQAKGLQRRNDINILADRIDLPISPNIVDRSNYLDHSHHFAPAIRRPPRGFCENMNEQATPFGSRWERIKASGRAHFPAVPTASISQASTS